MPRVATFCPRCGESIDTELPEEARIAGRAELACPSCKFRFVIAPSGGTPPADAEEEPAPEGPARPDGDPEDTEIPTAPAHAQDPGLQEGAPQQAPAGQQWQQTASLEAGSGIPQASDARTIPKKRRSGSLPARLLSAALMLFLAAGLGLLAGLFFSAAPSIFDEAMTGPPGSGEFSGVILDSDRQPLEGVTVALLEPVDTDRPDRDTPAAVTVETDAEGRYSFTGIDPGTHWVRVAHEGHQTSFLEVMVFQDADQPAWGDPAMMGEITLQQGAPEQSNYTSQRDDFAGILRVFQVWAWIAIPLSLLAAMGGVMVLLRRGFPLAVVGAAAGLVAFGFILGFIFSLVALILILTAKHEFAPLRKQPEAAPPVE